METRYVIYVPASGIGSELEGVLVAVGGTRVWDPHDTYAWYVPAAARAALLAELERRSAEFVTFYQFVAGVDDPVEERSAYLGLNVISPQEVSEEGPLIVKDPNDFRIVVDQVMRETLRPITRGLVWRAYEKEERLSFLDSATELPDPIELPGAREVDELDDGSWDISADGREVMTRRNLEHLRIHGIAYSVAFKTREQIYRRRPFPVFGGKVIDVAERAGVDMVIYLPSEDYQIPLWG